MPVQEYLCRHVVRDAHISCDGGAGPAVGGDRHRLLQGGAGDGRLGDASGRRHHGASHRTLQQGCQCAGAQFLPARLRLPYYVQHLRAWVRIEDRPACCRDVRGRGAGHEQERLRFRVYGSGVGFRPAGPAGHALRAEHQRRRRHPADALAVRGAGDRPFGRVVPGRSRARQRALRACPAPGPRLQRSRLRLHL